jgi:RND family efflux transporter MFP subunit
MSEAPQTICRRGALHHRALVLPLIALLQTGCGGDGPAPSSEPIRPAKLLQIDSVDPTRKIELPAFIAAAETANITFQVGGVLEELRVKAGDEVAQGDVIGRLNQREFSNSVDKARAEFTVAESQFKRAEQLIGDSLISKADYEQLDTRRNIARAALDSAEKALEDTTLRSPFDGVVATVAVDQFQNVTPSTPIVTIQTTGIAEAVVQIPSMMVAKSGQVQTEELVVLLDAAPEQPIPAIIHSVNAQGEAATQTFTATLRFTPPADLVILPGMTGMVRAAFRAPTTTDSAAITTVPLEAVMTEGTQQFVWVVDTASMTVSKRAVTLVPGVGEALVVQEGLAPGDTIVVAGAAYLFEGMTIRPYEG